MPYTVLARRYRSNTFDQVVGQDHIAQTLKKAIESGRIAHAYLFCGTRGVGKTSMARILAKALNCQKADKPTPQPCGQCNACTAIAAGQDIDVIEIDAASNTGVDNVRDLIANAQFRPAYSRFKVYIIDEVHMLSKSAFNALLKTLEEPPEHVKFILATTEPEKVLPTILSRCQRYDFRNIPTRQIAQHLADICKKEKIQADEDALLLIARAGAGSMRDALSLLDRLLSIGQERLTVQLVEQLLGMPKAQSIFDLVQCIARGQVKQALESADCLLQSGLSAETLTVHLADHFHNLLILRTCGAKSGLVESPGLPIDQLADQAEQFDPAALAQDIAIIEELRRNLRYTQAGRALLDATLTRLALADQFVSVSELLERADAGQKKKTDQRGTMNDEPAVAVHQPSITSHQSIDASPDPSDLSAVWKSLLDELAARGPALPALLEKARLVRVEAGRAVLQYPHDQAPALRMLQRNGRQELIRDVLGKLLRQEIDLALELEQPLTQATEPPVQPTSRQSPAPRSPAPPPPAPEPAMRITPELRQQLQSDELIRAVMDKLGGQIIKVE